MIDLDVDIQTKTKTSMRPPSKYNVILHNDDVTTMDFVILILIKIFHKSPEEAYDLCVQIHEHDKGIAGTYSFEIALQKKDETLKAARYNNFPLMATVEEV
jgi:ATP-dependent Clp protease adaptor protein ClpS